MKPSSVRKVYIRVHTQQTRRARAAPGTNLLVKACTFCHFRCRSYLVLLAAPVWHSALMLKCSTLSYAAFVTLAEHCLPRPPVSHTAANLFHPVNMYA